MVVKIEVKVKAKVKREALIANNFSFKVNVLSSKLFVPRNCRNLFRIKPANN